MIERFFSAPTSALLTFAALLAPLSVACTYLLSVCMDWIFEPGSMPPNSVAEASANGLEAARVISALIIAPMVENFLCLLWATWLPAWNSQNHWWRKPLFIAAIASAFHALIFFDIRPIAVFPGFFVIAMYIVNVKDRNVGYWASVFHHFCINAINLWLVILVSD